MQAINRIFVAVFDTSPILAACLRITQDDLAKRASVSPLTIRKFETGAGTLADSTVNLLRLTLQDSGIEFIPENGGGEGVRLRERHSD